MEIEKVKINYLEAISAFDYNPETGVFTRKHNDCNVRKGDIAGSSSSGYIRIHILGRTYSAQNLAWLIMTGVYPEFLVDHVDGDPLNNKWNNLRSATSSQNSMNARIRKDNTSGFKGVCYRKDTGRYRASIVLNRRLIVIGNYDSAEEANEAVIIKRRELHGSFSRNS